MTLARNPCLECSEPTQDPRTLWVVLPSCPQISFVASSSRDVSQALQLLSYEKVACDLGTASIRLCTMCRPAAGCREGGQKLGELWKQGLHLLYLQ